VTAERDADWVAERDARALASFVEKFAAALTEGGIPRMPSRVFAALLTSDSGSMTAAELGEVLQASPAAVSGGVRYLMGVGMVSRQGAPGSRRHHYQVPDDVWQQVVTGQDRVMARWSNVLRDGVDLLGADTPAGARMADSVQFFEFVSAEVPAMLARWQETRRR
jgi:predicted transcriptional regulator